MKANNPLILLSIVFSGLLLLGACSDDSAETSAPTAAAPAAESAPAAASAADTGGDALSVNDIEKADGVVYQDEIYAKWPK